MLFVPQGGTKGWLLKGWFVLSRRSCPLFARAAVSLPFRPSFPHANASFQDFKLDFRIYNFLLHKGCPYHEPDLESGKSSERHAEGARPPRMQTYISVIFGLLSQSRS